MNLNHLAQEKRNQIRRPTATENLNARELKTSSAQADKLSIYSQKVESLAKVRHRGETKSGLVDTTLSTARTVGLIRPKPCLLFVRKDGSPGET